MRRLRLSRVLTGGLLGAAILLSLTASAVADARRGAGNAGARVYMVRAGKSVVTQIGSFRPRRNPRIVAAVRAFGRPSSRRLRSPEWCVVKWRRLRLRIDFLNLRIAGSRQTTCRDTVGLAQSVTIKGRRFRTWNGLRVGDGEDLIELLHPSADFRRGDWWLRTAFSPVPGGGEYPVVSASIGSRGRVQAISGWIGRAGE